MIMISADHREKIEKKKKHPEKYQGYPEEVRKLWNMKL